MYHHILPEGGFITTPVELFRKQMELILELGYTPLWLSELEQFKRGELEVERGVVITFDDGWRDNYYYGYPILKELGIKGNIFLVTEWVEESSRRPAQFNPLPHNRGKGRVPEAPGEVILNWGEVEEMGDLIQFGSHTHSHRDFYFGREYSWEEEFFLSREILERRGFPTSALCWPRGQYSEEVLQIGKRYYSSFWTTERGVNLPDRNLDRIKRIAVKNSVQWLRKQLFLFSNPILGTLYSSIKK
jgi:peptidoglycan/xylan/chitin deacetylase (PgdA/CDA1 family)